MNDSKFSTGAFVGAGLIVLGSLVLALVLDDTASGAPDTGRIFLAFIGFGTFISGIGVSIAAAAAYLRKN